MNTDGLVSSKNRFWGDPVASSGRSNMRKGDFKDDDKGPPCKGMCSKTGWTIDQFCVYCHDS